ncbi:MAG: nitroreductase [Spirochaetes bacterium]|nr:nitroreductase [Spirochaetota bacterium]
MTNNEVLRAISSRRSIRKFTGESAKEESIRLILEAGQWAPSGLNNQPWRFMVVDAFDTRERLAALTKYTRIVRECAVCIAVFYHHPEGYDRDKDAMAIGACIQNMLLAAHSLGLGAVWLGEILNRKEEVARVLSTGSELELMALIALGIPAESPRSSRKELQTLIIEPPVP